MDMKAEIFKKLKYATYDLRASRIGSVSESDNNREVRKFIQARELITSVQSTKYNKNEILEYILEAKKQNYYSVYEIESNGEIVGAIIVHPVHKVIASGGVRALLEIHG